MSFGLFFYYFKVVFVLLLFYLLLLAYICYLYHLHIYSCSFLTETTCWFLTGDRVGCDTVHCFGRWVTRKMNTLGKRCTILLETDYLDNVYICLYDLSC